MQCPLSFNLASLELLPGPCGGMWWRPAGKCARFAVPRKCTPLCSRGEASSSPLSSSSPLCSSSGSPPSPRSDPVYSLLASPLKPADCIHSLCDGRLSPDCCTCLSCTTASGAIRRFLAGASASYWPHNRGSQALSHFYFFILALKYIFEVPEHPMTLKAQMHCRAFNSYLAMVLPWWNVYVRLS